VADGDRRTGPGENEDEPGDAAGADLVAVVAFLDGGCGGGPSRKRQVLGADDGRARDGLGVDHAQIRPVEVERSGLCRRRDEGGDRESEGDAAKPAVLHTATLGAAPPAVVRAIDT
jgi:hypothetical protein